MISVPDGRGSHTQPRPDAQPSATTGSGTSRPVVAVLTTRWESGSEPGWAIRQIAGAMACVADVHVVTPQGTGPSVRADGVFTLHETGTPVRPVDELSRDTLIGAFTGAGVGTTGRVDLQLGRILDRGQTQPWEAAAAVLAELHPDRVVVAGHLNMGALRAVDRAVPDVPVSLVPLAVDALALAFPHFGPLLDRAESLLALSEAEAAVLAARIGDPARVHWIGAPLAANPSSRSEPNTWVGDTGYVLVLTDASTDDGNAESAVLARSIRLAIPDPPVGISTTDGFHVWHEGRRSSGWPVERSSDLARLIAWAAVTVDLRPGPLFARRCVESLLYGTPIVVPSASRAADLARRSRGGLWYSSPGELIWSIEALLGASTRTALSVQGRRYAEAGYGTTDGFVRRVLAATGLAGRDRSPGPRDRPATGSPVAVGA